MYFKKSLLTVVCALFLFSCSNSKADSQTAITSSSLAVSKNAIETQNEFVSVSNKLKDSVEGKEIVKVVVVPNKLVNIVVK